MIAPSLQQAFLDALASGVFSGAQVRAGRNGKSLYAEHYGRVREEGDAPAVEEGTRFDIASLTKPLATAMLVMRAEENQKLDLSAAVQDYLPAFRRAERLTLRQLLAHTSGLPAWLPLYEACAGRGLPAAAVRESYLAQIAAAPLLDAPGTARVYSDLGFILLGFVLEAVDGRSLDQQFQSEIAAALELGETGFLPLRQKPPVPAADIVATEACPWRGRILQGEVHDDNAFVLGGVAGHAGLFGTARDLERWAQELLAIGSGKHSLVSTATLQRYLGTETRPRLGFDSVEKTGSQAGRYFSDAAVGHLAFTGCSVWLDFKDGKYIVLLTNRVHPRRDNEAIKTFRPRIHDLLVESLRLSG